jgi:hypothetical protein
VFFARVGLLGFVVVEAEAEFLLVLAVIEKGFLGGGGCVGWWMFVE